MTKLLTWKPVEEDQVLPSKAIVDPQGQSAIKFTSGVNKDRLDAWPGYAMNQGDLVLCETDITLERVQEMERELEILKRLCIPIDELAEEELSNFYKEHQR